MIGTPRHAAVPAGEIAYRDEGTGPAVVLLHGFPTTSFLWREFVPLLAGRFRVIAPDLLGAGDSRASEGASTDPRTQAAAVEALLRGLDVDRFAVVGHGVGGVVAQLLALDASGVDAMVLLDSVALDGSPMVVDTAFDGVPSPAEVEAAVRRLFETGIVDPAGLREPALEHYLRSWESDDGGARFAAAARDLDGGGLADRERDLARIGFPVLILWGEDDPFITVTVAERLNEAMPSSTLGLLPGCGHFLPEEAPETIGPMIAEYLRARFLMEPHGHDHKDGVVMLQLERRPPWVDLAADEEDDWFDVGEGED